MSGAQMAWAGLGLVVLLALVGWALKRHKPMTEDEKARWQIHE